MEPAAVLTDLKYPLDDDVRMRERSRFANSMHSYSLRIACFIVVLRTYAIAGCLTIRYYAMMSLKQYAYRLMSRSVAAGALAAVAWMAMAHTQAAAAKADEEASSDDPLSRARRNIVAVLDWDKNNGKAVLGTGILLQRDKALIPCRVANAARNLGVSQQQRRSEARLTGERS